MKTINCWDDIREYGIVMLTGEACGLSYRLLCDVTAKGKATLEKALGVPDISLSANWNHGSDDDPHIGSVMVPHLMLPFLGIFALLEAGCTEIWIDKDNRLYGMERSDSSEDAERLRKHHPNLTRRFGYAGDCGDRNQHQMSGRIR